MIETSGDSEASHSRFQEFKQGSTEKLLSDTEAALLYLRESFPTDGTNKFPPVHFLHQIYAIVKNKTKVDREASDLQSRGKIVFYKLGGDKDNIAEIVIFTEDIKRHILNHTDSKVVEKFLDDVLPLVKNVFVDAETLMSKFSFSKGNITELVQAGVLVIRDVGSYWLSFPRAGEFVRAYNYGRREFLKMIKKSKYSELLESELKKRKLGKRATLGIMYHITDAIGSEDVKCIHTTSGPLLRIDT